MKDDNVRYRRQSIYLLLLALLLVLLTFLLGPNLPLLLVGVVGLGGLALLVYSGYRRDLRSK
jgi:hypothetical protein